VGFFCQYPFTLLFVLFIVLLSIILYLCRLFFIIFNLKYFFCVSLFNTVPFCVPTVFNTEPFLEVRNNPKSYPVYGCKLMQTLTLATSTRHVTSLDVDVVLFIIFERSHLDCFK